jgi:hypothetical protein
VHKCLANDMNCIMLVVFSPKQQKESFLQKSPTISNRINFQVYCSDRAVLFFVGTKQSISLSTKRACMHERWKAQPASHFRQLVDMARWTLPCHAHGHTYTNPKVNWKSAGGSRAMGSSNGRSQQLALANGHRH